MISKESGFLRWNLLLRKTAEMVTEDTEGSKNSVDKAVAGFKWINSNFKRRSSVDKMLSNSTACSRVMSDVGQTSLSYLKKLPQPP